MIFKDKQIHVLSEGNGDPVICIHAAGSSGIQWNKIKDMLKGRYTVVLPDLFGEGKTPALEDWSTLLDDETHLIRNLITDYNGRAHLVGHSYGGVLAMRIALSDQHLIKSLTLIEPVAFNLLTGVTVSEHKGLYETKDACLWALENGNLQTAAELFYSYWKGNNNAWDTLPKPVQIFMAGSMTKIMIGWEAIFKDNIRVDDFKKVTVPALIISGTHSPAPTRWICSQLAQTIPGALFHEIQGGGHLSPVTHPEMVNKAILKHIDKNSNN